MSASKKLTDAQLRAWRNKRTAMPEDVPDGSVSGLRLRLGPFMMTWSLRLRVEGEGGVSERGQKKNGKLHRVTLGEYPETTLDAARGLKWRRARRHPAHFGPYCISPLPKDQSSPPVSMRLIHTSSFRTPPLLTLDVYAVLFCVPGFRKSMSVIRSPVDCRPRQPHRTQNRGLIREDGLTRSGLISVPVRKSHDDRLSVDNQGADQRGRGRSQGAVCAHA
jgi:hypothetical protein